jgi:hypothetical protein
MVEAAAGTGAARQSTRPRGAAEAAAERERGSEGTQPGAGACLRRPGAGGDGRGASTARREAVAVAMRGGGAPEPARRKERFRFAAPRYPHAAGCLGPLH